MTLFNLTRYGLLALVAVSLGTWGVRTWGSAGVKTSVSDSLPSDGLAVINFHGATRCNACREIGTETHDFLEKNFASDLKSGRMTWHVINFEEPAYHHYVKDYGLVASTVVVVRREHGHDAAWRRLDAVWDHVFEVPAMDDYLRREIAQVSRSPVNP
jgi:hypothetical protein